MNINEARAQLDAAGWSSGDVLEYIDVTLLWLVFCHRGDQKLIARSESREAAWAEAVRLASGHDDCH